MEPFSVSLNQINFERQTLGEKYENLNSFSNLVSYDEEFTGDVKSAISPNLYNYSSEETNTDEQVNSKNEPYPYSFYFPTSPSSSFKAFTGTVQALAMQTSVIGRTDEDVLLNTQGLKKNRKVKKEVRFLDELKENVDIYNEKKLDEENINEGRIELVRIPASEMVTERTIVKKLDFKPLITKKKEVNNKNIKFNHPNLEDLLQEFDESIKMHSFKKHDISITEKVTSIDGIINIKETGCVNCGEDGVRMHELMKQVKVLEGRLEAVQHNNAQLISQNEQLANQTKINSKIEITMLNEIDLKNNDYCQELLKQLEGLNEKKNQLEEIILEANNLIHDKDEEIRLLMNSLENEQATSSSLDSKLNALRQEFSSKEAVLSEMKAKAAEWYQQAQSSKQSELLSNNHCTHLSNELADALSAKDWYKDQLFACQREKKELQNEIGTLKMQCITKSTNIEKLKAENVRLRLSLADMEQQLLKEKQLLAQRLEDIEADLIEREVSFNQSNKLYFSLTSTPVKAAKEVKEEATCQKLGDETSVNNYIMENVGTKDENDTKQNKSSYVQLQKNYEEVKESLENYKKHYQEAKTENENNKKVAEEKHIELNEKIEKMLVLEDQIKQKEKSIRELEQVVLMLQEEVERMKSSEGKALEVVIRERDFMKADLLKAQNVLEQTRKETKNLKETHSATESKLQVLEQNLNLKNEELAKLKDLNIKLTIDSSEKNSFKTSGLILHEIPVPHIVKEIHQLNSNENFVDESHETRVNEHYKKDVNITDDKKILSYIAQIEEMRIQLAKLGQDKLDLTHAVDGLKKTNTELDALNISFQNKEKQMVEEMNKVSNKKLEDMGEFIENLKSQCNNLNEKYITENKEKQLIAAELLNEKKDSFEMKKKLKDLEEKYNDLLLIKNSSENRIEEKTVHMATEPLQNFKNTNASKVLKKDIQKIKKIHYEGLDVSNMIWQKEEDNNIIKANTDENVERSEDNFISNNERLVGGNELDGSMSNSGTQSLQGVVQNMTQRGAKESEDFIKQLQLTNHTMLIQELNTKVILLEDELQELRHEKEMNTLREKEINDDESLNAESDKNEVADMKPTNKNEMVHQTWNELNEELSLKNIQLIELNKEIETLKDTIIILEDKNKIMADSMKTNIVIEEQEVYQSLKKENEKLSMLKEEFELIKEQKEGLSELVASMDEGRISMEEEVNRLRGELMRVVQTSQEEICRYQLEIKGLEEEFVKMKLVLEQERLEIKLHYELIIEKEKAKLHETLSIREKNVENEFSPGDLEVQLSEMQQKTVQLEIIINNLTIERDSLKEEIEKKDSLVKETKKKVFSEKALNTTLKISITELNNQLSQVNALVEVKDKELVVMKNNITAHEEKNKTLMNEIEEIKLKLDEKESELNHLRMKISDSEAMETALMDQIKSLEWKVEQKTAEVTSIEERMEIVSHRHTSEMAALDIKHQSKCQEFLGLESKMRELLKERVEMRSRIVQFKQAITDILKQHTEISMETSYNLLELKINKVELQKLLEDQSTINVFDSSKSALKSTLSTLSEEIISLRTQVDKHTYAAHTSSLAWKELGEQVLDLQEVCKFSAANRASHTSEQSADYIPKLPDEISNFLRASNLTNNQ